ncbi:hypothetical protein O988_09629, partial [Pseudogymnoascus sp. VKM F-3808]
AIAIIVGGRGPVNSEVFVVVHTVLQVIINTTLACLPGKTIRKLKISRKQKTPMILILIVGFLSVIATTVGGKYRLDALTGIESSLNWARGELAGSIEIAAGVICLSFPAWKTWWKQCSKRSKNAQNSYSTEAGPGERTAESSLELGKVTGEEEEAHDTFSEQISAT